MNVNIILNAATEIKRVIINEAIAKIRLIKIWEKWRCQLVIKLIKMVSAINEGKIKNWLIWPNCPSPQESE